MTFHTPAHHIAHLRILTSADRFRQFSPCKMSNLIVYSAALIQNQLLRDHISFAWICETSTAEIYVKQINNRLIYLKWDSLRMREKTDWRAIITNRFEIQPKWKCSDGSEWVWNNTKNAIDISSQYMHWLIGSHKDISISFYIRTI